MQQATVANPSCIPSCIPARMTPSEAPAAAEVSEAGVLEPVFEDRSVADHLQLFAVQGQAALQGEEQVADRGAEGDVGLGVLAAPLHAVRAAFDEPFGAQLGRGVGGV